MKSKACRISGKVGKCGAYEVFLGFASAGELHALSFADVLDESNGQGYQRPRDVKHSASFRDYIRRPDSSTITLTFNLRPERTKGWQLARKQDGNAVLTLDPSAKPLAQVDCQHRLGELAGSSIPLAFMAFIGLDYRSETAMFTIINSKAKGLSSSLTDYHNSNLIADLFAHEPQLYVACRLNTESDSPWFGLIKLGGKPTPGLKRRTSLRMMQTAIGEFFEHTPKQLFKERDTTYQIISDYWKAVAHVFSTEWYEPRHHLITKGVGLNSLMHLAADFVKSANGEKLDKDYFVSRLSVLKGRVDWKNDGAFSAISGKKGVKHVTAQLREALRNASLVG